MAGMEENENGKERGNLPGEEVKGKDIEMKDPAVGEGEGKTQGIKEGGEENRVEEEGTVACGAGTGTARAAKSDERVSGPRGDKGRSGGDGFFSAQNILDDIELPIQVRLGKARLCLEDALKLAPSSIIELDRNADDPVEIWIQDNLLARGEIIVMEDYYAVRIMEIENKNSK